MANRYESRSGMNNSYGNGRKTRTYQSGPTYSGTRHTKSDTYYGGKGKPDGPGHGHKVKAGRYDLQPQAQFERGAKPRRHLVRAEAEEEEQALVGLTHTDTVPVEFLDRHRLVRPGGAVR